MAIGNWTQGKHDPIIGRPGRRGLSVCLNHLIVQYCCMKSKESSINRGKVRRSARSSELEAQWTFTGAPLLELTRKLSQDCGPIHGHVLIGRLSEHFYSSKPAYGKETALLSRLGGSMMTLSLGQLTAKVPNSRNESSSRTNVQLWIRR